MSHRKKFSSIWNFFTDCGDYMAKCDSCEQYFSFKTSISNLKRHIERKHPVVEIDHTIMLENTDPSVEIIKEQSAAISAISETQMQPDTVVPEMSKSGGRKKSSALWDFFTDCGSYVAKCNSCQKRFSFRSSISNLKRHLERKHSVMKIENRISEITDPTVQVDEQSPIIVTIETQSEPDTVIPEGTCESDSELSEHTTARKKSSPIWELFTDCGNNIAKCDTCEQYFSFRSSISNLKRHIERKHPQVITNSTAHEQDEAALTNTNIAEQLSPLFDRVLVKRTKVVTKTKGGVAIPERARPNALYGTIVSVGPGARSQNGEFIPLCLKVGDRVLLPEYCGTKVELEKSEFYIYRECDILAKLS